MDKATVEQLYDQGYMCAEGTANPFPPNSEGYNAWQRGYDDSIIANAQNLPEDHPDVLRLNCGLHDSVTGLPRTEA